MRQESERQDKSGISGKHIRTTRNAGSFSGAT